MTVSVLSGTPAILLCTGRSENDRMTGVESVRQAGDVLNMTARDRIPVERCATLSGCTNNVYFLPVERRKLLEERGLRPARETIVTALVEARRLLIECGWTRFATARDGDGIPCGLTSESARQFDLAGALTKAVGAVDPDGKEFYFKFFRQSFAEALQRTRQCTVTYTHWNDHAAQSSDDVVQLIDEVIKTIKAP